MTYAQCWTEIAVGCGADMGKLMQYLGVGLVLWVALGSAVPAAAQEPAVSVEATEEEGPICLLTLSRWNGNSADIKAIESVPVPRSYKAGYRPCGPGCEVPYWSADLLGWHGRFGTEQSGFAAATYIQEREDALLKEARKALATIKSERAHIAKLPADKQQKPVGDKLNQATNVIDRSLNDVAVIGNDVMFLAERFSSVRLRNQAAQSVLAYDRIRRQLPPPAEVAEKAASRGTTCTPECWFAISLNEHDRQNTIATLRLRIALFDAQRDEAQVPELLKLVVQSDRPEYQRIEVYVYSGDSFCDIPDHAPANLVKACTDDEGDLERNVLNYHYFREMLLMLLREEGALQSFPFMRLSDRSRENNGSFDHARRAGDDRVVTLERAQAVIRWEQGLSGTQTNGRPDIHGMNDGLALLMKAIDQIRPTDDPVLFRKMATEALRWDAEMAARDPKDYTKFIGRSKAKLDYYRLVLSQLDAIVADEYDAENIKKIP